MQPTPVSTLQWQKWIIVAPRAAAPNAPIRQRVLGIADKPFFDKAGKSARLRCVSRQTIIEFGNAGQLIKASMPVVRRPPVVFVTEQGLDAGLVIAQQLQNLWGRFDRRFQHQIVTVESYPDADQGCQLNGFGSVHIRVLQRGAPWTCSQSFGGREGVGEV